MVLKNVADLYEISICLGELLSHLSYGHRSTNTCNDVLALCVHEELTHELLLACSGVTRESNAGSGILIEVAEYHRHYVYGCSP